MKVASRAVLTIVISSYAAYALGAIQIPISGYDIGDAVISGHGNWSHTFSGVIAPGVGFTNSGFGGTTATYLPVGSGTLNDGVIGNSVSNSQLFVTPAASDGTSIDPFVSLTLPFGYTVDTIDIYGGPTGNFIPGSLTAVTVGLLDTNFVFHQETFNLTPFGPANAGGTPVNDTLSLIGSSLDGIAAFNVALFDFQGTFDNWFSITEIELFGDLAPPDPGAVPETSMLIIWLVGGSCAAMVCIRQRHAGKPAICGASC